MTDFDFMMQLECIAIEKGLRLFIERAPLGCGFFLYFENDENRSQSPTITWLMGREEPEVLFTRLRKLADEFNNTQFIYTD